MANEYATNLAKVKTAMDNRYENKQANKKDNISGDFTNDEVSYPTVRAVKQYIGAQGYLTQHQNLDNYVQKSQTEGLIKNDGTVMTLSSLEAQFDGLEIAITEKGTPNIGALKTYQITQGEKLIGEIDTPKDFLVKSGSVKTAEHTLTSAESAAGVGQGEKYISLIINTKDDTSGTGTELIIPATGLVEDTTYQADNITLKLDSSTNTFKVKTNGIDTLQLKDASVTANKIDSTVKDSWLDNEDVDARINQALSDLADLIDPPALDEGKSISLNFSNIDSRDIKLKIVPRETYEDFFDGNYTIDAIQIENSININSLTGYDYSEGEEFTINITNQDYLLLMEDQNGNLIPSEKTVLASSINNSTPQTQDIFGVLQAPYITVDDTHTSFDIVLAS